MLFGSTGQSQLISSSEKKQVIEKVSESKFLNHFILGNDSVCESLQEIPQSSSLYLTNITCDENINGDINGDSVINIQDIILTVNLVLQNNYNSSADLNIDGAVDVLDIVQLVNLILN